MASPPPNSNKKKVSFFVDAEVMNAFEAASSPFVHNKQKGLAVGAALLMFLESDPKTQGDYIERVAVAEIRRGVDQMLEQAKRTHQQRAEQASREDTPPSSP